ncbi:hypothetical protein LCGC14_2589060, partial [marine sediment metagenome]
MYMVSMPMKKPQTLSQDQVIVPASKQNYMEVRHLVLQGSDREIGLALGDYARNKLGVEKLEPYRDPIYGRARQEYLGNNFPALLDRSRGVADAYGLEAGETRFDTTSLVYDFASFGCSAIFFPPDATVNGHPLVARNLDWYIVSAREMTTGKSLPNDPNMMSRSFLAEFYPESGFASIQTTATDFLNFPHDGVNEHGLFSTVLVDQQGPGEPIPLTGGQDSGLNDMQVIALLMNKCKTVEEAKIVLLQNRIYMPFEAMHWLIADAAGSSTIFEIDGKSGQYYFIDGEPGKPQVVTNHAIHRYPNVDTFPNVDPKASYNSFIRYRHLVDSINSHQGKFSVDDCFKIISEVFGRADDAEEVGGQNPLPMRTLWTLVMDLADRNIAIKYFLRDD